MPPFVPWQLPVQGTIRQPYQFTLPIYVTILRYPHSYQYRQAHRWSGYSFISEKENQDIRLTRRDHLLQTKRIYQTGICKGIPFSWSELLRNHLTPSTMYHFILTLLCLYNHLQPYVVIIQDTIRSPEIYCNTEYPNTGSCIPLPQYEKELANLTGHGSLISSWNQWKFLGGIQDWLSRLA